MERVMWWFASFVSVALAAADPTILNPSVSNGSLVAIELDPQYQWAGKVWDTEINIIDDQGKRIALFGVPYNQEPKSIEVEFTRIKGAEKEVFKFPVTIGAGDYPSETLRVSPKHVNPSAKDLKRIEKEKVEVGKVYSTISPQKLWTLPFVVPVTTEMTSVYGTRRVFNGELQSYHNGIDFRAKVGRRIRAANAGKVVLAKHLFFTGNTVILDHGAGVMTLYAHMSRLDVKKGQKVKQRALLGLAGQTGRANGPHLHFSAIINRVRVNPVDLFAYLGDRKKPVELLKRAAPSNLEEGHATSSDQAKTPTLVQQAPSDPKSGDSLHPLRPLRHEQQ
jgi:murein DD-endopeptidase MepM/ murein hydrolase activator NlpD